MELFDLIVEAYENTPRGHTDIEVKPGVSSRIFFKKVSLDDMEAVKRKHGEFLGASNTNAMLEMIVRKAEKEDGSKMFSLEQLVQLRHKLDPLIAAKVYRAIMEGPSVEDHVKN